MEQFTEEHNRLLLSKEWMVKIDSEKATPYLLKYSFSPVDLTCLILVTDTKKVWAEVVNSKLLARRWRLHNTQSPEAFGSTSTEDAWREQILELITKAHTIGGIMDLSFEVMNSNYADLALEIECDAFKWRWETCFLGYQQSSEIISKHLIFPLISLNHLTFASAEAVGELSDTDLEKAVDKVGRTARRTVDTHIKNALSKPRISTSIRRISAIFNFVPDLPPVTSIAEKPYLHIEPARKSEVNKLQLDKPSELKSGSFDNFPRHSAEQSNQKRERIQAAETKAIEPEESETESDTDEVSASNFKSGSQLNTAGLSIPKPTEVKVSERIALLEAPSVTSQAAKPESESDSSPPRPVKKIKPSSPKSSDEDSDNPRKPKERQSGPSGGGIKRGTRQPIKRGGKRF